MYLNKQQIIGYVGRAPEEKKSGEKTYASFSVATSHRHKDRDGNPIEYTEWHNVTAWGKLGEIALKHVIKGAQVYVNGDRRTRSYEKEGLTKTVSEIMATDIIMLGSKRDQAAQQADPAPTTEKEHDDLPF